MMAVVFDSSALRALFSAHWVAVGHWKQADIGLISAIFPAAAVADANSELKASYDAWSGIFWGGNVSVAPLDGSAAVEVGLHGGDDLALAHVIHEARATDAVVLTSSPQAYAGTDVPVLVL